jgi:hypothetical protein
MLSFTQQALELFGEGTRIDCFESCRLTETAGVSEVSRFSCMKFLGVSGVFDYAGLSRCSRYRACSCCLPHITRASASGLSVYGAEYPPRLSSVYASLSTSRYPAQDSRPSGSVGIERERADFRWRVTVHVLSICVAGYRGRDTGCPVPPAQTRTGAH